MPARRSVPVAQARLQWGGRGGGCCGDADACGAAGPGGQWSACWSSRGVEHGSCVQPETDLAVVGKSLCRTADNVHIADAWTPGKRLQSSPPDIDFKKYSTILPVQWRACAQAVARAVVSLNTGGGHGPR